MTSRERVRAALAFRTPDRVPLDLGGTRMSGIHAEAYSRLRQALGCRDGATRAFDMYQLICEVELPLVERLGVDVLPVHPLRPAFGLTTDQYRPFRFWWTPPDAQIEVPAGFNPTIEPDGGLTVIDAEPGRRGARTRMPPAGWYFDRLDSTALSDDLTLEDLTTFRGDLRRLTDAELDDAQARATALYRETDKALVGGFYLGGLSGPGSLSFADWMIAHVQEPAYVADLFDARVEVTIENLQAYHQAVGDRIEAVVVSGVDYGTQRAELFAPDLFRELYVPAMRRINAWIHARTPWKTLYHSDGSMRQIIGDMIEAGVDILNPVQWTTADMELADLKATFGDRLVFWGAGPDPQQTLPFGTPDEVAAEVRQTIDTLAPGGGFVFAGVHNIQAQVPTENLLALFNAFAAARDRPRSSRPAA